MIIKLRYIKVFLILVVFAFGCKILPAADLPQDLKQLLDLAIDNCFDLCNHSGDSCLAIADDAIVLAEKHNADSAKAELLRVKGLVYFYRVDYTKALEFFIESRDLNQKIGNVIGETNALSNIGLVYTSQGMYQKTLQLELGVLKKRLELGDESRLGYSYNNIAVGYYDLKEYRKALSFYKKAVEHIPVDYELKSLALYNNNIGNVYLILDMPDSAKFFFDKGLDAAKASNDKQVQSNSWSYLGDYYIYIKQYEMAIDYLQEAMHLARETGIVYEIGDVAGVLHDAYEKLGNYKQAYKYYVLADEMADSANNIETAQKLVEIEARIKYEKEKQIQDLIQERKDIESGLKLKQQKVIRNIVILFATFVLIILFYLYLSYRRRGIIYNQVVMQRDEILTQKEEIETQRDEIQTLNNTKDKFFTIIAHDLKNPIGAMFNLAGVTFGEYDTLDEVRKKKYTEQIFLSAKKTYDLLDNLLHWATIQTGTITATPVRFNLTSIIKDSIELVQSSAEQKQISIMFEQCDECWANADVEMITTVVRNLLQNAIKFSPNQTKIKLDVSKREDFWKVSVADQGIGMSVEDQAFVFDKDFDKKKIGKSREKGTGLGLMLCKEFVELNGGVIWVESELDNGSVFCFTVSAEL